MKTNISLLISGKLGFQVLLNLTDYCIIEFIATDRNSTEIIDFAKRKNILLFIGNPRKEKLSSYISEIKSNILLSINYLFIIEDDVITKFKFPINFHGSLLPKYRGRTPHVWAIINNEIETGVTAHFIDNGCDTGDIILQEKIKISEYDTGFSILEKYADIYPRVVKEVITLLQTGNIIRKRQDNSSATVYGKRTPDDGKIDWNWQKERIKNWVRAQSFPYPGAFTFYDEKKIIIDEVSFCEIGFNNELPNGTILQVKPTLVAKTSNGSIKIDLIRCNEVEFIQNKILT
jgi:methionyl-tRNA formyltransferase